MVLNKSKKTLSQSSLERKLGHCFYEGMVDRGYKQWEGYAEIWRDNERYGAQE